MVHLFTADMITINLQWICLFILSVYFLEVPPCCWKEIHQIAKNLLLHMSPDFFICLSVITIIRACVTCLKGVKFNIIFFKPSNFVMIYIYYQTYEYVILEMMEPFLRKVGNYFHKKSSVRFIMFNNSQSMTLLLFLVTMV